MNGLDIMATLCQYGFKPNLEAVPGGSWVANVEGIQGIASDPDTAMMRALVGYITTMNKTIDQLLKKVEEKGVEEE